MNNKKASYVLQEIRNIPLYEGILKEHTQKLKEIEKQKETYASPKSPQGHENIGASNQHNGNADQTRLLEILEKQDDEEYKMQIMGERLNLAKEYKMQIMRSGDSDFVNDYINGMRMKELSKKHSVSNPYDKMMRIIKYFITDLKI